MNREEWAAMDAAVKNYVADVRARLIVAGEDPDDERGCGVRVLCFLRNKKFTSDEDIRNQRENDALREPNFGRKSWAVFRRWRSALHLAPPPASPHTCPHCGHVIDAD